MVISKDLFFEPGQPKCTFNFETKITSASAVNYEELKSADFLLSVEQEATQNQFFLDGKMSQNPLGYKTENTASRNIDDLSVDDIDDMPPVFLYKCDYQDFLSCPRDTIEISVAPEDCNNAIISQG